MTPGDLQAVFVYGTLRPRHGRSGWAVACEVAPATRGYVPGKLYVGPGFPYARYLPGHPTMIVGDVLLCDRTHPKFRNMCGVEHGAGYSEIEVPVTLEGGSKVGALMFVGDRRASYFLDEDRVVPSGDWHDDDAVWNIEQAMTMERQFGIRL